MSTHIQANPGEVAKVLLMPGDPRRAERIAGQYFEGTITRFNGIRGMHGYTGTAQNGKEFSVHASGMTQPSLGIYVNEFFKFHGVEQIIRIGTFGSYSEQIPCRSIFIPDRAITDSNMFPKVPVAYPSPMLYRKAMKEAAHKLGSSYHTGTVFSTDTFYPLDEEKAQEWKNQKSRGVIGVEMESHALFCLGNHYKKETMTILMASDNLTTGEHLSAEEREIGVHEMMKVILEII